MRFETLDMAQLSAEQQILVDQIAGGPRGAIRGPFLALLHHPKLASRVQAVGEHLRYNASVEQELVELVILVTARRWNAQYEWFAHSRIAHTSTSLSHEAIEDVRNRRRPTAATERQLLAYDMAVALHGDGQLSDDMFATCQAAFGVEGFLDLVCTCGYYTTIALVLNVAQMELPTDAPTQYLLDR